MGKTLTTTIYVYQRQAIRQAECPTFEISFENLEVQALLMQVSHDLFVVLGKVISLNKKRPLPHACRVRLCQ